MTITFSQQILDDKLLWAITREQEINLSGGFKLKNL